MFVAVADELHFGRAAIRLNMTQPPLSQHIRELETELGAQLFIRSTRSVQLTTAGKILLERTRRMLADSAATLQEIQRATSGATGVLALGFVNSAAYALLPRVLSAYRSDFPDVAVDLTELTSGDLLDALSTRRIDIALVRASSMAKRPGLEFSPVLSEPMVLALPRDHPLARRAQVPLEALQGIPFVGFDSYGASYFKETMEAMFAKEGVTPHVVYKSLLPTILALVEAEIGLAIVPASASHMRTQRLAYRPLLTRHASDTVTLYCVRRAGERNPTVDNFWERVHSVGRCISQENNIDSR